MTNTTFVDPGGLRHRLILEQRTDTPDGAGGITESWTELGRIWGRVSPVSPSSGTTEDQVQETMRHRVIVRFRQDITSDCRFLFEGRELRILTVHDPDESKRYLICAVDETGR
ncbi:MAG: phage head closure protein [Pseudomonadota bacterium]